MMTRRMMLIEMFFVTWGSVLWNCGADPSSPAGIQGTLLQSFASIEYLCYRGQLEDLK